LEAVIAPSRGVAFDWAHAEVRNQKLPGCWAYSRALCPSLAGSDPAPVSAEWHRIHPSGSSRNWCGMRPYLPCVLGTSTGHETENRRKPNHNRIQALWKSSHPVTLPTRINSTSEPLPKRLYSAKISRALWLARFSRSPLSCPLGQKVRPWIRPRFFAKSETHLRLALRRSGQLEDLPYEFTGQHIRAKRERPSSGNHGNPILIPSRFVRYSSSRESYERLGL